jgi:hypothetical protein
MTAFPFRRSVLSVLTGGLLCLSSSPSHAVERVCVYVEVGTPASPNPIVAGPACVFVPPPIDSQCEELDVTQAPVSLHLVVCY